MSFLRGKTWGAGIILSIALLSSCRSLKNTNTLFQSEYDKFADTAKSVYVANGNGANDGYYKLKPFDQIAIRNIQNPEGLVTTGTTEGVLTAPAFRVDRSGSVSLPGIGAVDVKDLTQEEAEKKIQALYGKALLKNPIIELTILNQKVTVLGEVARAGNFQLDREDISLVDILGRANGLTVNADPKRVKIIRGDLKNPEVIYVNLKDLKALTSDKTVLKHNDIVYVAPKGMQNLTQGVKGYSELVQPAILVINAVLLLYTFSRL